MDRLIAILLIPFYVMGNSLAHSHGIATFQSVTENRAHIHVNGGLEHDHGSHGHSHKSHHHDHRDHDGDIPDSTPADPVEHDSDAVYLVATDSFFTSERGSLDFDSQYFRESAPRAVLVVDSLVQRLHIPPLSCTSGLPLYLLLAALRL